MQELELYFMSKGEFMLFDQYKSELIQEINNLENESLDKLVDAIMETYRKNKTVYVFGNGGSAATASHFQCDMGKGTQVEGQKRLRVLSLTDNIAIMSAISNDISYDDIFAYQLENLVEEGDLVVGISASGNSENVIRAMKIAKQSNARTFAIVGFDGGKMKELADQNIHIRSYNYGIVEDLHLIINHLTSQRIKEIRTHE